MTTQTCLCEHTETALTSDSPIFEALVSQRYGLEPDLSTDAVLENVRSLNPVPPPANVSITGNSSDQHTDQNQDQGQPNADDDAEHQDSDQRRVSLTK